MARALTSLHGDTDHPRGSIAEEAKKRPVLSDGEAVDLLARKPVQAVILVLGGADSIHRLSMRNFPHATYAEIASVQPKFTSVIAGCEHGEHRIAQMRQIVRV
jgi:hypothetical protein